jgi:hypothetical protein
MGDAAKFAKIIALVASEVNEQDEFAPQSYNGKTPIQSASRCTLHCKRLLKTREFPVDYAHEGAFSNKPYKPSIPHQWRRKRFPMSKKKLKLSNTEIALGSEDYYPERGAHSHRFA